MIVRKHTFDTIHYNHYCINNDECIFSSLIMKNNRQTQLYFLKSHDVSIF